METSSIPNSLLLRYERKSKRLASTWHSIGKLTRLTWEFGGIIGNGDSRAALNIRHLLAEPATRNKPTVWRPGKDFKEFFPEMSSKKSSIKGY